METTNQIEKALEKKVNADLRYMIGKNTSR